MEKNCLNCKHIEWVDGDTNDPSGFICTKRNYRGASEEDAHIQKMQSDVYLKASKSCCDLKDE